MMHLFNWHVGDPGRCKVVAMSAPGWGRTQWLTTTRIHRHEELNIYVQIILESKYEPTNTYAITTEDHIRVKVSKEGI